MLYSLVIDFSRIHAEQLHYTRPAYVAMGEYRRLPPPVPSILFGGRGGTADGKARSWAPSVGATQTLAGPGLGHETYSDVRSGIPWLAPWGGSSMVTSRAQR